MCKWKHVGVGCFGLAVQRYGAYDHGNMALM